MNFLEGTEKEFSPFQNVHVKPGEEEDHVCSVCFEGNNRPISIDSPTEFTIEKETKKTIQKDKNGRPVIKNGAYQYDITEIQRKTPVKIPDPNYKNIHNKDYQSRNNGFITERLYIMCPNGHEFHYSCAEEIIFTALADKTNVECPNCRIQIFPLVVRVVQRSLDKTVLANIINQRRQRTFLSNRFRSGINHRLHVFNKTGSISYPDELRVSKFDKNEADMLYLNNAKAHIKLAKKYFARLFEVIFSDKDNIYNEYLKGNIFKNIPDYYKNCVVPPLSIDDADYAMYEFVLTSSMLIPKNMKASMVGVHPYLWTFSPEKNIKNEKLKNKISKKFMKFEKMYKDDEKRKVIQYRGFWYTIILCLSYILKALEKDSINTFKKMLEDYQQGAFIDWIISVNPMPLLCVSSDLTLYLLRKNMINRENAIKNFSIPLYGITEDIANTLYMQGFPFTRFAVNKKKGHVINDYKVSIPLLLYSEVNYDDTPSIIAQRIVNGSGISLNVANVIAKQWHNERNEALRGVRFDSGTFAKVRREDSDAPSLMYYMDISPVTITKDAQESMADFKKTTRKYLKFKKQRDEKWYKFKFREYANNYTVTPQEYEVYPETSLRWLFKHEQSSEDFRMLGNKHMVSTQAMVKTINLSTSEGYFEALEDAITKQSHELYTLRNIEGMKNAPSVLRNFNLSYDEIKNHHWLRKIAYDSTLFYVVLYDLAFKSIFANDSIEHAVTISLNLKFTLWGQLCRTRSCDELNSLLESIPFHLYTEYGKTTLFSVFPGYENYQGAFFNTADQRELLMERQYEAGFGPLAFGQAGQDKKKLKQKMQQQIQVGDDTARATSNAIQKHTKTRNEPDVMQVVEEGVPVRDVADYYTALNQNAYATGYTKAREKMETDIYVYRYEIPKNIHQEYITIISHVMNWYNKIGPDESWYSGSERWRTKAFWTNRMTTLIEGEDKKYGTLDDNNAVYYFSSFNNLIYNTLAKSTYMPNKKLVYYYEIGLRVTEFLYDIHDDPSRLRNIVSNNVEDHHYVKQALIHFIKTVEGPSFMIQNQLEKRIDSRLPFMVKTKRSFTEKNKLKRCSDALNSMAALLNIRDSDMGNK